MRGFEVVSYFNPADIILPTRATEESAGYDIRVLTKNKKSAIILPGESKMFDTGIKAFMEKDEVLKIYIRSSIGIKKHLVLSNCVGIIDSDYYNNIDNEGHIMISLTNISNSVQYVENNERVAQGIFVNYLITYDDNVNTHRMSGIGSTDTMYSSFCA